MTTDIPISNIYVARNNWHLKSSVCRKYRKTNYRYIYRPLKSVFKEVISRMDIPENVFISKTRKREIVEARQIYFKRAKVLTSASLTEIGSMVVNGDHATVLHGINQVDTVPSLKRLYAELFNGLKPVNNCVDKIKKPVEKIDKPEFTTTKVHLSLTGKPTY